MLKTALFDSLPKDVGVNCRKNALDGPDFDIRQYILDFAMVNSFAAFLHLCHNIVLNMIQSYLLYFYWNTHTWKLRFRHQNHLFIATRTEVMKHLPKYRFCGRHFEKRPKLVVSSSFFFLVTSLIWFLRVPWTKWYHSRRIMGGGGGGGGGAWGPPLAHGLFLLWIGSPWAPDVHWSRTKESVLWTTG